jgi:hypothetical protein
VVRRWLGHPYYSDHHFTPQFVASGLWLFFRIRSFGDDVLVVLWFGVLVASSGGGGHGCSLVAWWSVASVVCIGVVIFSGVLLLTVFGLSGSCSILVMGV